MKSLHKVTYILLVVGGVNWGLYALDFNLVYMLLGSMPTLEKAVYLLVGLSAIYEVVNHRNDCKNCSVSNS